MRVSSSDPFSLPSEGRFGRLAYVLVPMIVEPRIRLFPNPDFDEKAKAKWDPKAFYEDHEYRSNPELVRPLRAGVSCAICHVAAHPLNPPADPAEPKWQNLSAITLSDLMSRDSCSHRAPSLRTARPARASEDI
jgi:hypothetical protein